MYHIFYTDGFPIRKRFGGITLGFLIFIRPKYKDDVGLHEHEIEHVRQWWTRGMLWWNIRYLLSSTFRLKQEVEAYRIQLDYYDYDLTYLFAEYLYTKYGIKGWTYEEIVRLLQGEDELYEQHR